MSSIAKNHLNLTLNAQNSDLMTVLHLMTRNSRSSFAFFQIHCRRRCKIFSNFPWENRAPTSIVQVELSPRRWLSEFLLLFTRVSPANREKNVQMNDVKPKLNVNLAKNNKIQVEINSVAETMTVNCRVNAEDEPEKNRKFVGKCLEFNALSPWKWHKPNFTFEFFSSPSFVGYRRIEIFLSSFRRGQQTSPFNCSKMFCN